MKFQKYSSIENSYREKEIEKIYKYGFADKNIEWAVTEKTHGCLKWDTLITMANGEEKFISDIQENDYVLTFNEKLKELESKKVKKVICQNLQKKWIKLTFENGKGLILTEDHKVFTKNRGWVEAKDLNFKDELLSVL